MRTAANTPAVVDVFCGVGGLSHGFRKEGFKILGGIDVDPSCKYAFETNNDAPFIERSVEDLQTDEVSELFGKHKLRILIGCAPCQPFSPYNRKKNETDNWKLLRNFSQLVSEIQPDIISMENVPQLVHHPVFAEFIRDLESADYEVTKYIVFCPDYGIPQRRRRLVLFASKFGRVELLPKTHTPENYRLVRDAISKLSPLKSGGVDPKDPLHRCRNLSPLNLERIRNTPEGGAWQTWDDSLKLDCHKKRGGVSFRAVYGRMRWDGLGSTITTEFCNLGTGRFGHPDQDRTISIREAAMFQTFPKYFRFVRRKSDITFNQLTRHIGNAVPVKLGRVIAKSIKLHLEQSER
ncbi:MAG: DNA cytosine methyltransferase [Thaumarchaeota archaeon]|nr:DNA cytosine methyltransferase [Nitrososphaerota archaeon]